MSFLGIDLGTSGCKAVAFNRFGEELHRAYRAYDVLREAPGAAELDVREVWSCVAAVIRETAAAVNAIDPPEALCTASMGEAFVTLDGSGNVMPRSRLGSDTRDLAELERIFRRLPAGEIRRITAHHPGGGFALHNLSALRRVSPTAGRILFWADFVTWKLSGVAGCCRPLAARSLLLDSRTRQWSKEIIAAAEIDPGVLPILVDSGAEAGTILPEMAAELGLPETLRVFHGTHDQCANALGAGSWRRDEAMLGLGTFACMVLNFDGIPDVPELDFEPHAVPGKLVAFLYHGSGGALIHWLRQEFYREIPEENAYRLMDQELELSEYPVIVLPEFTESGPPERRPGMNGAILGLSLASRRADIYRGALEGIIFYFRRALENNSGIVPQPVRIHAAGGGANSPFWLQLIADILQCEVIKPRSRECGALGVAILAACGAGSYGSIDEAVGAMVKSEARFLPGGTRDGALERRYGKFCNCKDAVIHVSEL